MVHATQKGEIAAPSKAVAEVAEDIKPSDATEFASTKHKGLPVKKKEEKKAALVKMANLLTNFVLLKNAGLLGGVGGAAAAPGLGGTPPLLAAGPKGAKPAPSPAPAKPSTLPGRVEQMRRGRGAPAPKT